MVFPEAGVKVAVWIPPVVAFGISFFTSMGGLSGAVLLLPFQMSFLGYVSPSVSATNHLFNVLAIPGGVYGSQHERRMLWPLVWILAAGTIPGVFIGTLVRVTWLPDPRHFKLYAAALLLYVGTRMAREIVLHHRRSAAEAESSGRESAHVVRVESFSRRQLRYTFSGESFTVSVARLAILGFAVGIAGGVYGIGGGSIVVPFLVAVFGLPVKSISGAALMCTFLTSGSAVVFFHFFAGLHPGMSVAPDWPLAVLFGVGGMAGIFLGTRCQKYVPARVIRGMLALIVLSVALRYAVAFFEVYL